MGIEQRPAGVQHLAKLLYLAIVDIQRWPGQSLTRVLAGLLLSEAEPLQATGGECVLVSCDVPFL